MLKRQIDRNMKWQVRKDPQLLWRFWDDEIVVYNTESGDTHLLDSISSEALKNLESSPSSIAELSCLTKSAIESTLDQRLEDYFEKLIMHLWGLRLIEPVG
jgi:PqqD family protein of HPr-rel-A system